MKKLLAKLGRLTNFNNHTEAVLELAKYLEDQDAITRMEDIKLQHDVQGYINQGNYHERHEILNRLLLTIKERMGAAVYQKFYQSF